MVLSCGFVLQLSWFQAQMIAFEHHALISGSQTHVSLLFLSCAIAILGHEVQSVYVNLYNPFLPWSVKCVLSEDFPPRKGKQCVALRKHKYLMILAVKRQGKMHQFNLQVKCMYSALLWRKAALSSGQECWVQRKVFLQVQSSAKALVDHTAPFP